MTREPDVLVVGGGLAGLTVTLALARRGQRVLLVDEPRPGAATRASAGMLAAGFGFAPPVAGLAAAARARYPDFVASLRDATGIDVPLDRRGIIELADDDDDRERMHALAPASAERLTTGDVARLEPVLASHAGGLLHPLDGAVDAARLLDALDRAVESHPDITRVAAAVRRLRLTGGGASLDTGAGTVSGGCVVLAAGAWAGGVEGLPTALPVRPVRGELMLLANPGLSHVTYGGGGYLIPRGAQILVGATSDDAGFDARSTAAGRGALVAIATRMSPGLAGAAVSAHWAGLRPMSPDGLPIVGVDAASPSLAYACGYSRNGILFAPWLADRLADELLGAPSRELDGFRIERFGRGDEVEPQR